MYRQREKDTESENIRNIVKIAENQKIQCISHGYSGRMKWRKWEGSYIWRGDDWDFMRIDKNTWMIRVRKTF